MTDWTIYITVTKQAKYENQKPKTKKNRIKGRETMKMVKAKINDEIPDQPENTQSASVPGFKNSKTPGWMNVGRNDIVGKT